MLVLAEISFPLIYIPLMNTDDYYIDIQMIRSLNS